MNDLVFIEPNNIKAIPFTTSDVIAEYCKISHHAVQQTIIKHEHRLNTLGKVAFEMRALKRSKTGQSEKIYHLTEPQSTLLITFLKNTDIVADFKTELVRQLYLMRTELQKRQIAKIDRKPIRRSLTDAIQDDPDHGKWDFKIFTDLIYKIVTGKNAAQLRKDRGASKKDVASDFMTAEEIQMVAKLENQVSVLKELGMDYHQIKMMLLNRQLVGNIA